MPLLALYYLGGNKMDESLVVSDEVQTLFPACMKIVSARVIKLYEEFYLFLNDNCGDTYIFKIIQCIKPSEEIKDIIQGLVNSYAAWFNFEGRLFITPNRIVIIWLSTFRKCVGCSTKEQCAACLWAAMCTLASCFPQLFPARILWAFTNIWVRCLPK